MAIYKRGKKWYCRFNVDGKQIRKPLSTNKQVAKEMAAELEIQYRKQSLNLGSRDYDYSELKTEYLRHMKLAGRRVDYVESNLRNFESWIKPIKLSELTPKWINRYREHRLDSNVGPHTINNEVSTVKRMLDYAVEQGYIAENPAGKIRQLKRKEAWKERRVLEVEEIKKLLAIDSEWVVIWETFLKTGLRNSELRHLEPRDVLGDRIRVRSDVAKTGQERLIPLPESLKTRIMRQVGSRFVFETPKGREWDVSYLLKCFYRDAKKAGIEDAKPRGSVDIHSLRVTYCSQLLMIGTPPHVVQKLMGHATLDMTMRIYAKVSQGADVDAVSKLPY